MYHIDNFKLMNSKARVIEAQKIYENMRIKFTKRLIALCTGYIQYSDEGN
jgi:hypothetical protein